MFPLTSNPQLLHAVLEALAISLGTLYYRIGLRRKSGGIPASFMSNNRFLVLIGCLFGAALGNKIVFWLEMPHLFPLYWNKPEVWFAGQSVVGGLLGGLIGVEIAKRGARIRQSTGDAFVFPVLLGLIIGRVGCFAAGLADGTYGVPTGLPWGVDFGDGVPRHPTQLYEIIFAAVMWVVLARQRVVWSSQPGLLFKVMLWSYLLWRFMVDGIKPNPFDYGLGLSGIQVVCAVALVVYAPLCFSQWRRLKVCGESQE